MRTRTIAITAALAASAGLALVSAPTAAAADPASVDLRYTQTYFVGTINWYNRSVGVEGTLRALSTSCRRVYAEVFSLHGDRLDHRSTSTACAEAPESIPLAADVQGGAIKIVMRFTDADDRTLDYCVAYRGDPACT